MIGINELYPINNNNNYYIANNKNELKNILISILKILLNISHYFSFKSNLDPLLEIEFELKGGALKEKKMIIIKIYVIKIYYKNIHSIENFNNNQPIVYDLNPILFYNVLITWHNFTNIFRRKIYWKRWRK